MGDKPFVIESERTFTSAVSDTIIANSFSANDNISLTNGMGHGLLISGMDWYTVFANDTLPIASVVETSYEGRACYKVIAGEIEVAKRTSNVAYFDKNNFMVFLYFYTFNPPGKSPVMCEEIVEYDSKGNDFDSIVIKSYRDYFESKGQNLPRQLSNEHIFTTYKTETHPPEVFRLEQYGLPDVAEQPKGTSRTAVALIAAGVVLGGFLLVAWLRGRRAAKTA